MAAAQLIALPSMPPADLCCGAPSPLTLPAALPLPSPLQEAHDQLQGRCAAADAAAQQLAEQCAAAEAAAQQGDSSGRAQQQLALAAQELQVLQQEEASCQQALQQVQGAQARNDALQAAAQQLQVAVARQEGEVRRLQQLLGRGARGQAGADADGLSQRIADLQRHGQQLAAAAAEQEAELGRERGAVADVQRRLAAAQQAAAGLSGEGGEGGGREDPARALAEAQVAHQQATGRAQQLQHAAEQARVRAEVVAAGLSSAPPAAGSAAASGTGGAPRRLHQCFRVRDPGSAASRQMGRALAVIAGSALDVVVVEGMAQASAVLAAQEAGSCAPAARPSRLRIWPLSQLTVQDRTGRQRQAAETLGPGRACLPLDWLDYEADMAPAMLHAFGGLLIAGAEGRCRQVPAFLWVQAQRCSAGLQVRGHVHLVAGTACCKPKQS